MGATSFGELREEISALDVDARMQRLRDNEAQRRALEADDALVLDSLERDKAYQRDGHATMYGMLRSRLGWSGRECRMHMQIARLVAAEPSADKPSLSPVRAMAPNDGWCYKKRVMDDEFRIETFAADDHALGVRVHGELDTATADRLVEAVEAWPEPVSSCVVDLDGCEFLDSSGIHALLLCQRRLDSGHGTLRLIGVKPHIERVLRIAGVQEVVQFGT